MSRVRRDMMAPGISKEQLRQLIKEHRENEEECRWCFAIDLKRVKAEVIDRQNLPDATVLHLKCPKCGGEFSYYIRAWGQDYIKERIEKLHPELAGHITEDMISIINDRLWPEHDGDC